MLLNRICSANQLTFKISFFRNYLNWYINPAPKFPFYNFRTLNCHIIYFSQRRDGHPLTVLYCKNTPTEIPSESSLPNKIRKSTYSNDVNFTWIIEQCTGIFVYCFIRNTPFLRQILLGVLKDIPLRSCLYVRLFTAFSTLEIDSYAYCYPGLRFFLYRTVSGPRTRKKVNIIFVLTLLRNGCPVDI